jgi:thioredoxin-related protein
VIRRKFSLLVFIISFFTISGFGHNKPDSAEDILNKSLNLAKESNKQVLLIFHASWCIWCKHLDSALESRELKKIIDEHFIVAYIDVLEKAEKKEMLENSGGEKIMNEMGGEDSGLPFYVFLDSSGKKIIDSKAMPEDQNIGYPSSVDEINAFTNLLKTSDGNLTKQQLSIVHDYLVKNAPN